MIEKASKLRVLLAEDDPDIRLVMAVSLEKIGGFEVNQLSSGIGVVKSARTFKPHLIILDVMMPQIDGPGALKALHSEPDLRDIPVVFLTAKAMTREMNKFLNMGVADIIIKPFDPMELPDRLKGIIKSQTEGPSKAPGSVDDVMKDVRARFINEFPERLHKAQLAFDIVETAGMNANFDMTAALYNDCHSLAGAAGMVGAVDIAELASKLDEILIFPFMEKRAVNAVELASANAMLEQLHDHLL